MTPAAFKSAWESLDAAPLTPDWFDSLRGTYRDCSASQNAELRRRLGWSPADCREPDDPFAADWSERNRPHFATEQRCIDHLLRLARTDWPVDYRDALLDMSPRYHAAILAGFDPTRIFDAVATQAPPATADLIRGFIRRPDKWLPLWGFEPVRLPDGHVHVQSKGL